MQLTAPEKWSAAADLGVGPTGEMKRLLGGAILLGFLPSCGFLCPEEFITGVSIPTGSTMEVLAQGNGRLYSMHGAERITNSELKQIALFYVLILTPDAEVRGGGSGMHTRCLRATEKFTWQMGNWKTGPFDVPDHTLELHYDGRRKMLTVGAESLPTTESNCFIVRLDSAWQPTVSRVRLLVTERVQLRDLMDRFRQAEVSSPDVRDARLHGEASSSTGERPNKELQRTRPAQAMEPRR